MGRARRIAQKDGTCLLTIAWRNRYPEFLKSPILYLLSSSYKIWWKGGDRETFNCKHSFLASKLVQNYWEVGGFSPGGPVLWKMEKPSLHTSGEGGADRWPAPPASGLLKGAWLAAAGRGWEELSCHSGLLASAASSMIKREAQSKVSVPTWAGGGGEGSSGGASGGLLLGWEEKVLMRPGVCWSGNLHGRHPT